MHSKFEISTKYLSGEEIKENGMGGACGTYVGRETHVWFWWANLKEGYHLEDLGTDEIILK